MTYQLIMAATQHFVDIGIGSLGMKILVLSQHWYPENGVHQRRWSWLSELLTQAGHEVTVICPPPHYQRKVDFPAWVRSMKETQPELETGPSGEKILRSIYLPAGRSLIARALNQGTVATGTLFALFSRDKHLKNFNPDLVIGTVPAIPTAIITPIVAKILKAPYVIDLRDAWPDLLTQRDQWNEGTGLKSSNGGGITGIPMKVLSFFLIKLMHASYESAKGMMVTSEHLAHSLQQTMDFKGKDVEVVTIRNVFPPKSPQPTCSVKSLEENVLNVLYAGTLGRAQKLSNALYAVKLAEQQGVKVNLRFVGAGVAREELLRNIQKENVSAVIHGHVPAHELQDHYDWADTALVHLTDWEPLKRAIPSKTYELMASGIHITGVVKGETADLITALGSGHVVDPENPEALAELWIELARGEKSLHVSEKGQEWVEEQRNQTVPDTLLKFINKIGLK